ncbi:hypothetical protein C8K36_102472 [Rhodococcus sp. OK519]|uniref:hypothetical protein n=1 Tax=Rhodococcus sp. OK519 TaxID=2135729 RepID=UPI000D35D883|nr:hypothetical protein C8K36_102472 [Rhodococcus sp. OK519]
MSTAEQIIAEHQLRVVHLNEAARYPECTGCDWVGGLLKDHAAHVVAALTNAGYLIVEADRLFELANNPVEAERDGGEDEPSLVKFGAVPVERLRWIIASSIIEQSPAAARVAEVGERGEATS